ncbi:NERD domain-containing protein [Bacillus sp. JCM 19041]|uniref:nuclease-related domain-containing protein n=1 Tax=Bacillus sp. JCM 19041 TaxID=1460637 RepID=UPI0006CF3FBD
MISTIKHRTAPAQLLALKALEPRLHHSHPKRAKVEKDLIKQEAGFAGERSINYYLTFLPKEVHYRIFHDLRIRDRHAFQMDTLMITENYIVLLEIKHYTGYVELDLTGQLNRYHSNQKKTFPNPLAQVSRQQTQLENVLHTYGFPPIPIYSYVLFTSQNVTLDLSQTPLDLERMIRLESLPKTIEQLNHRNTHPFLTTKQIQKLSSVLLKLHQPQARSPLATYSLSLDDIIDGALCPHCKYSQLTRNHYQHYWRCNECGYFGKEDHLKALHDYALLIKKEITNTEARRFLLIESRDKMYRMLVEALGKPSGKYYSLETLLHE